MIQNENGKQRLEDEVLIEVNKDEDVQKEPKKNNILKFKKKN